MIQANSSQRDYTLNGATIGSVYTVGIAASNVLGTGTPITATISQLFVLYYFLNVSVFVLL